jgi:hypothetical protein
MENGVLLEMIKVVNFNNTIGSCEISRWIFRIPKYS